MADQDDIDQHGGDYRGGVMNDSYAIGNFFHGFEIALRNFESLHDHILVDNIAHHLPLELELVEFELATKEISQFLWSYLKRNPFFFHDGYNMERNFKIELAGRSLKITDVTQNAEKRSETLKYVESMRYIYVKKMLNNINAPVKVSLTLIYNGNSQTFSGTCLLERFQDDAGSDEMHSPFVDLCS